MSNRKDRVSATRGMTRRDMLQRTAALAVAGPALNALLSGQPRFAHAAQACLTIPSEAMKQDLNISCAYAASPPALDEVAFTMETENLMALCYGGDLMQDKMVWSEKFGVCVANLAVPGNEGITGRWVEKWESSPDGKTWTFHLRNGIMSWAGNEMTAEDIRWTWERAFHMKSLRFFFATAMFLKSPDDVKVVDRYTVRFHLDKPCTIVLKLMCMNYYGGPFDSVEAKKHATPADPYAKEWLRNHDAGFGPYHVVKNVPRQELVLDRNPNYQPRPPIKDVTPRDDPPASR